MTTNQLTYISTRGKAPAVSGPEAIRNGIAPDGGLYVPSRIPVFGKEELESLAGATYNETALAVLRKYLPELQESDIETCIRDAYRPFGEEPVRLVPVDGRMTALELWHGPTSAFKDMALQLFPRLLSVCKRFSGSAERTWILTATSGDTGKAALEGFRDVPGTSVFVIYPDGGVSPMQELQMRTQEGGNVDVCAVRGNFDDAQSAVKKLFADRELSARLAGKGIRLSSANSINWGRLLPQIVYYVYASLKSVRTYGMPVPFVVPTGNFGNILAGYFARRMGCPVGRLFCASNRNDVLKDFFTTGVYNRKRSFYKTASPSMDILVSSNLERLLYLETGDPEQVSGWMNELNENGEYAIPDGLHARLSESFGCGSASDEEAFGAIRACFEGHGYLMDPHTAVGYAAYLKEYGKAETGPFILVSTASPYKFAPSVLQALNGENAEGSEAVSKLEKQSGLRVPDSLASLFQKPVRFSDKVGPENVAEALRDRLISRSEKC